MWTTWRYLVLAVMLLSVIFLAGIAGFYKSSLPLRPKPSENRTLPITITGSAPVYANARESTTWHVALYTFIGTGGLFLITLVTAEYFKQRRGTGVR